MLEIDRRSPERQVLHLAINSLRTAKAGLAATHHAVSDDWDAKRRAENELGALRTVASDMGATSLFEKIERAVESGVEPSIRFYNEAEEQLGKRRKGPVAGN